MLESLFGNRTAQDALFFLENYGEGYPRQIAATYGYALSTVQQQLRRFEDGGALVSRRVGPVRLYRLNPNWYFAPELAAILRKGLAALPEAETRKYFRQRQRPRKLGKPL